MASFDVDGKYDHQHPFDVWMASWNNGNIDWQKNEMPSDCELAINIDRRDFFPYCCIVCRRSEVHCEGVKLSRCSKCKRINYCSRKCQKKDFKKHKYYCQLMHDVPLLEEPTTWDVWYQHVHRRLHEMKISSESFYGKDIWKNCGLMWVNQPHCQTCFSQENLKVCTKCGCVASCLRKTCQDSFHDVHSVESCEKHCIRLAAYVMALQQGNYLKVASRTRYQLKDATTVCALPMTWGEYWTLRIRDYEVPEVLLRLPPVMAMLTDSMSYIFTALHCFQKVFNDNDRFSSSAFRVHFIGANVLDVFGAQVGVFEEILHWLPGIRQLEIVLVGRDMQSEVNGVRREIDRNLCSACRSNGCSVHLTSLQGKYHEIFKQEDIQQCVPTIAVMCNAKMIESEKNEDYISSAKLLLEMGTPIAVTSFTADESESNIDTLSNEIDLAECSLYSFRNPFRGLLPMQEPARDNNFYYNNNYCLLLDKWNDVA